MSFYILKNGHKLGPYAERDVHQLLTQGAFALTDLGWRDGLSNWMHLSEILKIRASTTTLRLRKISAADLEIPMRCVSRRFKNRIFTLGFQNGMFQIVSDDHVPFARISPKRFVRSAKIPIKHDVEYFRIRARGRKMEFDVNERDLRLLRGVLSDFTLEQCSARREFRFRAFRNVLLGLSATLCAAVLPIQYMEIYVLVACGLALSFQAYLDYRQMHRV
jgi:hypothetical protein